jgi:hypothetical protein
MSIQLSIGYAHIHAKVVQYPQKLDRPSQRTLIRPLKIAAPFVPRWKKLSAKG